MTPSERWAFACRCKEIGNRGFKASDWEYAMLAYQEGLRYLEYVPHGREMQPVPGLDHGGAEQLDKDMSLAVTLFSNLGAVSLKLEDPHQALHYTEKALRFDAAHVKSHFRRSQAFLALGEHSQALAAAEEVLRQEPKNAEAVGLKSAAAQGLQIARRKEKALFSKMLG
ncbi:PPID [Symbiodinium natans]|uniref:peptidylprolyl isomerase n=1 Tax=Symbiodinium natans TaxID=878477 RepID=A0A812R810_9DINO|nr:PPID [Symbiodinium natans]